MQTVRRVAYAAALVALPAAAQMTVTGRQVPARPDAPPVSATSNARSTYVLHCAGCHGMDGGGSRLGHVPDMRRLGNFLRLDGGRQFIISVPGVMGSGLSDADVAAVMNWVLSDVAANSAPKGIRPYDAEEISRARAVPLLDVAAQRKRLLEQARAKGVEIDGM